MTNARYVRPPGVAVVVTEVAGRPVTYLARLPDGPIMVLEDTSALIWGQAVDCEEGDVVAVVAAAAGAQVADIRDDVERFLADLVRNGLLLRQSPTPDS
jgi:hypothetical protein